MKIKPLSNRVLIKKDELINKTTGGILLASTAKERSNQGTIVAVGEGKALENGTRFPMSVKVGDRVVFASHANSQTIKDGEDELVFMEENEIYGVIDGE